MKSGRGSSTRSNTTRSVGSTSIKSKSSPSRVSSLSRSTRISTPKTSRVSNASKTKAVQFARTSRAGYTPQRKLNSSLTKNRISKTNKTKVTQSKNIRAGYLSQKKIGTVKKPLSPENKIKAKQFAKELKAGQYKFPKKIKPKSREGVHGYPYKKARKEFMMRSLSDPTVGKNIKGWSIQEIHRSGKGGYWRSPPGYDVGHRKPGTDRASNFQWEYRNMNRSKGAKYKR